MKEWAYAKPGHYSNYMKPHVRKVAADVQKIQDELPPHNRELDPEDKEVLLAEQHESIRAVSNVSKVDAPSVLLKGRPRYEVSPFYLYCWLSTVFV